MFCWFCLFVFFASFKTLLIQMDFQQNIDKGFSCIHHIIKNLELEIDFKTFLKKVHFLSNIAKFTSFYSWGPPLFVCDVILSWIQIFLVIGKQQREGRCVFVCICDCVFLCALVGVCLCFYRRVWPHGCFCVCVVIYGDMRMHPSIRGQCSWMQSMRGNAMDGNIETGGNTLDCPHCTRPSS